MEYEYEVIVEADRYLCDYKIIVMFLIIHIVLLIFMIRNKNRLLLLGIAIATMVIKRIYIEIMKFNKREYGYLDFYHNSNIIQPFVLIVNIVTLIYLLSFVISKVKNIDRKKSIKK